MSRHVDDSIKENLNKNGKILICPKCNETEMEFYYDDDDTIQYYCPNCDYE